MRRPRGGHAPALLVLALLTALPFYRVLLYEDRALLYRDLYRHFLVGKALWADAVRAGEGIPYWNSFSFGGMPFWAENVNSPLSPLNLLFLLVERASYPLAMNFYVWLHYLLLATGSYLLCRTLRLSRWPAVLFGSALALSGVAVSAHNVTHTLTAFCSVPWFFHFWVAQLRHGRLPALFGASFALAWPVYGGDPQAAYVLVLLSAVLTLQWKPLPLRVRLLRYAALGLLSLLASSAQLLPTAELIAESGRGFASLGREELLAFSFHPLRLLETLWPQFFGNRHGDTAYWGAAYVNFPQGTPFIFSTYPGALVLLLSAGSLLPAPAGTRRQLPVLWAAFLTGILLCFGSFSWVPLYQAFLSVLPLFGAFRYPERLLFWPFFALWLIAVLSSRGLPARLRSRSGRQALLLVVGSFLLFDLAALGAIGLLRPGLAPVALPAIVKGAAALLATGLLLWACAKGRLSRRLLPFALIPLQAMEFGFLQNALVWDQSVHITDPGRYPLARKIRAILESEKERFAAGAARRFDSTSLSGYDFLPGRMDHTTMSTFRGLEALVSNTPGYYGIEDSAGYFALVKREKRELWLRLRQQRNFVPDFRRLLELTGSYFLPYRDELQEVQLRRNERALPYVFLARELTGAATFSDALKLLADPGFDFQRRTVVTPAPSQGSGALSGEGDIRIVSRDGRGVRIRVSEGAGRSFLVWNESYDRHWKAYANGEEVPVHRANAWAIGVFLPAGAPGGTELRFSYENPLITLGCALTTLWAALFAAALLFPGTASRLSRRGPARL